METDTKYIFDIEENSQKVSNIRKGNSNFKN